MQREGNFEGRLCVACGEMRGGTRVSLRGEDALRAGRCEGSMRKEEVLVSLSDLASH